MRPLTGVAGQANRGKPREWLWILWRYDWNRSEWAEIARAASIDWEWAMVLREPAIRALHPRLEWIDVLQRGRDATSEIMGEIERRLQGEAPPVRCNALASIYDQGPGESRNRRRETRRASPAIKPGIDRSSRPHSHNQNRSLPEQHAVENSVQGAVGVDPVVALGSPEVEMSRWERIFFQVHNVLEDFVVDVVFPILGRLFLGRDLPDSEFQSSTVRPLRLRYSRKGIAVWPSF